MKEYIKITAVFAVLLMLIPCIVFLGAKQQRAEDAQELSAAEQAPPDTRTVRILFTKSGQIKEYSMQEYIIGAVLAQMPADYEPAALQAQAVLAHTYAVHRINAEAESPTPELSGAVLSDDTTRYHGFFTTEQAKELYKDGYDKAYNSVSQAVRAVESKLLTYDGKPVIVAFHAVSDGHTRSAKAAWDRDIPYLTSVESKPDEKLGQAVTKTTLTADDFKAKLSEAFKDISFTDKPDDWLKVTKTGEYSLAKAVTVCGKELPADKFCTTLGLASQSFVFEFKDDVFTFTCKGMGHLVGMSQYGANEMAKQGNSCDEILSHYFPACTLNTEH